MTYKNDHLSYSRLQRFEQCPLSFKLHYIDGLGSTVGTPLRFGKVIHAVLEKLLGEAISEERTGPLSEARAQALLEEAWAADGLSGVELFGEGRDILQKFVRDQGAVDHRDVLAVEKEFLLPVSDFTVLGYIDRVDRIDDQTVEVIDYKTNHQLFTRDEVDSSLQLSLYQIAAQRLWPWAKRVKLTYWMLRHGLRQTTERTPEQLEAVLSYVETLGRATEEATEFPARLNAGCIYCDHRSQCPTYADALWGKRSVIANSDEDLEAVACEREDIARIIKVLNARKNELESIIKTHLKDRDELLLGGTSYRMYNTTRVSHPLEQTIDALGQASGLSWAELVRRIAVVDKKALDALLKELSADLGRPRATLLKAELDARADKSYSPRLWAKEARA